MSKFINSFKKIGNEIIPFLHCYLANKKIQNRKNSEKISTLDNSDEKELKENYDRAYEIKKSLEDKAKNNIVAVTISITLIMGASVMMEAIILNPLFEWMRVISIVFFVVAISYMIFAGLSAFSLLVDKNIFYFVLSTNKDSKGQYFEANNKNNDYNLIRNNLINSSFKAMRNSLICLFIVMIMILINQYIFAVKLPTYQLSDKNTNIYYLSRILTNETYILNAEIETLINSYKAEGKLKINEFTGIIDNQNQLFIKVFYNENNCIYIETVEKFVQ